MYASVCYVGSMPPGELVSDDRPMKSVRRFAYGDNSIIVRAERDGESYHVIITRDGLHGELLMDDVLRDSQRVHVEDHTIRSNIWTVALSERPIRPDPWDMGDGVLASGRVGEEEPTPFWDHAPEVALEEIAVPVTGAAASMRDIVGLRASQVRTMRFSCGGFFDGWSIVEVWQHGDGDGRFGVRFWHEGGPMLDEERARQVSPPLDLGEEDVQDLIERLLSHGLGEAYSNYVDHGVCDGTQWAASVEATDGYLWRWSGSNSYPRGYDMMYDDVCEVLLGMRSPYSHEGGLTSTLGDRVVIGIAHLQDLVETYGDYGWGVQGHFCLSIRQDFVTMRRLCPYWFKDDFRLDYAGFANVRERVRMGGGMVKRSELLAMLGYILERDDSALTLLRGNVASGLVGSVLRRLR